MNDLREAARLALDALERGETALRYEAITALRAAIEQVQEPVAWAVEFPDGTRKPLYTHSPAREPVAVAYIGTDGELGWLKKPTTIRSVATPLYMFTGDNV